MLKKIFIGLILMTTPVFADYRFLADHALKARENTYSPYSQYAVGAALLTREGEIILGTNVENASYGMTICAERSAIVSAVSQGKKSFEAIAVATKDGGFPCGACRQVLNEFNPEMAIIIVNEKGEIVQETTLDAILPSAFGPKNLE